MTVLTWRTGPRRFVMATVALIALASVPAWQTSTPVERSQQPRQLAQPARAHVRSEPQVSKPVSAQSLQLAPPLPHALMSLPTRHAPKRSQHPLGHVDAVQLPGGWVVPESSCSGSRLVRPHPKPNRTNAKTAKIATQIARKAEGKRIECLS